jgi:tRNA(Ile)-lysidine synthase
MPQKNQEDNQQEEVSALIAVSGGLDSICLAYGLLSALNLKREPRKTSSKIDTLLNNFIDSHKLKEVELAYIDHSQRDDTELDIEVIKELAKKFPVRLHIAKLNLPKDSSEDTLRKARYEDLNKIMSKNNLDKLITAHHADDVIETAVINLKRGTGPKGLSSLRHHQDGIWRPFLSKLNDGQIVTKEDLKQYAEENNLSWYEDSTNQSSKYLRNRIRKSIQKTLTKDNKEELLLILSSSQKISSETDQETENIIDSLLDSNSDLKNCFIRSDFLTLDEQLQKHILHSLISQYGFDVNRDSVERAIKFIQTAKTKKTLQLKGCDIYIPHKDRFQIYSLARQAD